MRFPYWVMALASLCLGQESFAQSPFLRSTDKHTLTPEAVIGERKRWGADLSFGGGFNRGNVTINSLNGSFDLFKSWELSSAYLSGSFIYSTFQDRRTLNLGAVTVRADRRIAGPWKLFAFNTQAYNDFLRLDYRTTTGAGPWYDLAVGETRHGLSAALVHEYQRFFFGTVQRTARFSFRAMSRWPISPLAELTSDLFYVPRLDRISDYRADIEIGLETRIWRDNLGLKVSWLNEYENRPQPDVKHNDVFWLTSLTCHFGR